MPQRRRKRPLRPKQAAAGRGGRGPRPGTRQAKTKKRAPPARRTRSGLCLWLRRGCGERAWADLGTGPEGREREGAEGVLQGARHVGWKLVSSSQSASSRRRASSRRCALPQGARQTSSRSRRCPKEPEPVAGRRRQVQLGLCPTRQAMPSPMSEAKIWSRHMSTHLTACGPTRLELESRRATRSGLDSLRGLLERRARPGAGLRERCSPGRRRWTRSARVVRPVHRSPKSTRSTSPRHAREARARIAARTHQQLRGARRRRSGAAL